MKINFKQNFFLLIFLFGVYFFCFNQLALANDFSSSSFVVKDPVFSEGTEYSTSVNFVLWSYLSQNATGISTSVSNQLRSGFLYFFTSTSSSSGGGGGGGGGGSIFFSEEPSFSYPVDSGGITLPPKEFTCSKIVDLNCDGRVNLKDLSILFSTPKELSIKFMSLMFSGWTEKLSAPSFVLESRLVTPKTKINNFDLGLAQFESAISSTTKKINEIKSSITRSFLGFIRALGSFVLKIFHF
ncbi:MAG: hypothetical protein EXS49_01595 [Candidatus Pacebacteria bacterium]|nr:hypothetical protein [Candidatus Paceibacterota bacterium]